MDVAIGDLVEPAAPAGPEMTCGAVFDRFWSDSDLCCIPIVRDGRPIGLVHREEFLLTFAAPYRAELFAKRSITHLMDATPLAVETSWPMDAVAALLLERPKSEFRRAFILLREGRYAGICTPVALLRRLVTLQMERAAELVREREKAEIESRSKTHFLASTSHELRTPLNAIIGFADVIKSQVFGPIAPAAYAGYVDDILLSGHHLLDLINDILDVARIESGHMSLHETEFALAASAWEVDRLMRGMAEESGLAFTVEVPAHLPRLRADEQRVRQMMINLVSNAIKFTPRGGAVCLRAVAGPEGLAVSVRDTGIGMTPEDAARVLKPFEQVETWDKRTRAGTGLGLAIVKGMVEAHQGRIAIATAPAKGTTVTLHFPPERLAARPAVSAAAGV